MTNILSDYNVDIKTTRFRNPTGPLGDNIDHRELEIELNFSFNYSVDSLDKVNLVTQDLRKKICENIKETVLRFADEQNAKDARGALL